MAGTPLLSWYYRLMGARIGANVYIGTDSLAAFDLISIGDDTCIGVRHRGLPVTPSRTGCSSSAPVAIGRGCFVGNGSWSARAR